MNQAPSHGYSSTAICRHCNNTKCTCPILCNRCSRPIDQCNCPVIPFRSSNISPTTKIVEYHDMIQWYPAHILERFPNNDMVIRLDSIGTRYLVESGSHKLAPIGTNTNVTSSSFVDGKVMDIRDKTHRWVPGTIRLCEDFRTLFVRFNPPFDNSSHDETISMSEAYRFAPLGTFTSKNDRLQHGFKEFDIVDCCHKEEVGKFPLKIGQVEKTDLNQLYITCHVKGGAERQWYHAKLDFIELHKSSQTTSEVKKRVSSSKVSSQFSSQSTNLPVPQNIRNKPRSPSYSFSPPLKHSATMKPTHSSAQKTGLNMSRSATLKHSRGQKFQESPSHTTIENDAVKSPHHRSRRITQQSLMFDSPQVMQAKSHSTTMKPVNTHSMTMKPVNSHSATAAPPPTQLTRHNTMPQMRVQSSQPMSNVGHHHHQQQQQQIPSMSRPSSILPDQQNSMQMIEEEQQSAAHQQKQQQQFQQKLIPKPQQQQSIQEEVNIASLDFWKDGDGAELMYDKRWQPAQVVGIQPPNLLLFAISVGESIANLQVVTMDITANNFSRMVRPQRSTTPQPPQQPQLSEIQNQLPAHGEPVVVVPAPIDNITSPLSDITVTIPPPPPPSSSSSSSSSSNSNEIETKKLDDEFIEEVKIDPYPPSPFTETFEVGDVYDVMDKVGKWYIADIIATRQVGNESSGGIHEKYVKVRFPPPFDKSKYDEELDILADRHRITDVGMYTSETTLSSRRFVHGGAVWVAPVHRDLDDYIHGFVFKIEKAQIQVKFQWLGKQRGYWFHESSPLIQPFIIGIPKPEFPPISLLDHSDPYGVGRFIEVCSRTTSEWTAATVVQRIPRFVRVQGPEIGFETFCLPENQNRIRLLGAELPKSEIELRKELQMTKFIENLHNVRKDFEIVTIKNDGHCFYRSVAHQLFGDQELHPQVRQEVQQYMRENKEYFAGFFSDADELEERVGRNDLWGDDYERGAVCELYNRPIEILYVDREVPSLSEEDRAILTIRVLYTGSHYNSIVDTLHPPPIGKGEYASGVSFAEQRFRNALVDAKALSEEEIQENWRIFAERIEREDKEDQIEGFYEEEGRETEGKFDDEHNTEFDLSDSFVRKKSLEALLKALLLSLYKKLKLLLERTNQPQDIERLDILFNQKTEELPSIASAFALKFLCEVPNYDTTTDTDTTNSMSSSGLLNNDEYHITYSHFLSAYQVAKYTLLNLAIAV